MHGLADAVSGDSGQADAGFGFGLAGVARDGQELQTVGRLAAQAGDGLAGLIDAEVAVDLALRIGERHQGNLEVEGLAAGFHADRQAQGRGLAAKALQPGLQRQARIADAQAG